MKINDMSFLKALAQVTAAYSGNSGYAIYLNVKLAGITISLRRNGSKEPAKKILFSWDELEKMTMRQAVGALETLIERGQRDPVEPVKLTVVAKVG